MLYFTDGYEFFVEASWNEVFIVIIVLIGIGFCHYAREDKEKYKKPFYSED